MSDSIALVHLFKNELSDDKYQACNFPFLVDRKINEYGEVVREYLDWATVTSPLTGAHFKVRALPAPSNILGRIGGYEVEINPPACLIGRNHLLVNGVPRATEGALELLKHYAASAGCSPFGLDQFKLDNIRLRSVTGTFLIEFASLAKALAHLRELRNYAEGILNHVSQPFSKRKNGKETKHKAPCFQVGSGDEFTLYMRQRDFMISCYIKSLNVDKAFATFPSPEIERELVALGRRIVRIEVRAHGKWLRENGLDNPESWRNNPAAYEKLFELVLKTLRIDEGLRVRAPTEAVIGKLSATGQTILRAHLEGQDARTHELVLDCSGTVEQIVDAQNKKFSAFKCQILELTGVDISIPWAIQSTKLSPHLKDWLKCPGEFVPEDHLKMHVFSRSTVRPAIERVQAMTAALCNPPPVDHFDGLDTGGQQDGIGDQGNYGSGGAELL